MRCPCPTLQDGDHYGPIFLDGFTGSSDVPTPVTVRHWNSNDSEGSWKLQNHVGPGLTEEESGGLSYYKTKGGTCVLPWDRRG